MTQHTDRRGKVTSYTYDRLDRNTFAGFGSLAGPQYESTITYTYDTASRLTQLVDSVGGTIQLGYDNLDRLTSEISPQGNVSYTYDAADRRTSMTASGQSATNYSYDNADRLTQITQGTQSVSFTYDNANRRATLTLPNGIVATYSYDSASQLTAISYMLGAGTLGSLSYAYDNAGRRTSIGGSWARTNLPVALSSATYDAANQLTQWGTTTLTYDANGNLTNDGTNTLTWNARNQLVSMTGGISASFQYDGLSRRIGKTIGGVSTGFLHDGANPVQEQLSGGVNANLLTGLSVDEFFSRTDQLGSQNSLTDALGSTLALAGPSGALLTQYTYEPFGNTTVSGSTFTPFQYAGRENDSTGVYYYRARYYSPVLQRFLSEDPIEFRGGINLFRYALNNSLNWTDPWGLDVTVRQFTGDGPNTFGHLGLGVNTNDTVGFYPAALGTWARVRLAGGGSVPGEVRVDRGEVEDTFVIPTTPEQDRQVQRCIDDRRANPGNYSLYGRNCSRFVQGCLRLAGLHVVDSVYPRDTMRDLRQRYANRERNRNR